MKIPPVQPFVARLVHQVSRKKLASVFFVVLAFLCVGAYALSLHSAQMQLLKAEIAYTEGTVEFQNANGSWQKASKSLVLSELSSVRTGSGGRVIIEIDDGSAVRLDHSSSVRFDQLSSTHIVVRNLGGHIYTRVAKLANRTFDVSLNGKTYRSLGTAYQTVNETGSEGVEVYDSKVQVLGTTSQGVVVQQGERYYVVNATDVPNAGKVTEIDPNILASDDFVKWNKGQDEAHPEYKANLGVLFDLTPPVLAVDSPANGLQTAEDKVQLAGSTENGAKVLLDGQPLTVTDGKFSTTLTLAVGPNSFKIEASDASGNKTVKTITVTRTISIPAPVATPAGITLYGTKVNGGISFSWKVSGLNIQHGFKLVKSENGAPTYPGSDYVYLDNSSLRSYTWDLTDGQTYNFRICQYNGDGACLVYSNQIRLTVPLVAPSGTLTLTHISGNDFSWVLNGQAPFGYKLVWADHTGPVYPCDGACYAYYGDESTTSGSISPAASGTYYVRACMYTGDGCTNYSNELTVVVP